MLAGVGHAARMRAMILVALGVCVASCEVEVQGSVGDSVVYVHDGGINGRGAQHREDAREFRAHTNVVPLFMPQ